MPLKHPAESAVVVWLGLLENHFPSHPAIRAELRHWHRARFPDLYVSLPMADELRAFVFTSRPGLTAEFALQEGRPVVVMDPTFYCVDGASRVVMWSDDTLAAAEIEFALKP